MRLLVDEQNRRLWIAMFVLSILITASLVVLSVLSLRYTVVYVVVICALGFGVMSYYLFRYLKERDNLLEDATNLLEQFEAGNMVAQIQADKEGEIYRLFHEVNRLMEISSAQIESERQAKFYLKNTISDISHQLKTPLAALQIYNGILQDDTLDDAARIKFTNLSEQELDRIHILVDNLLKIAKLDAKTTPLHKQEENVFELMSDVQSRFAYRAQSEQKTLSFVGDTQCSYVCDRSWLSEAISNLVKNALDHTQAQDTVLIEWKTTAQMLQIAVTDNGCGIHPDDIYHIFKRFYRSRHSNDTQGIGLGLPLARAIVEAHGGTIEVSSSLGKGSKFTMNLLIPTKM